MKNIIAAAALSIGMATSAFASPFHVDLNDSGLTATDSIDRLTVAYDSFTEVDFLSGTVNTRAGVDLIGYDFGGVLASPVFSDFDGIYAASNLIQSQPAYLLGESFMAGYGLTFGLSLTGEFSPVTGIRYTSGKVDIYKYELEAGSLFTPAAGATPELLMSGGFVSDSVNLGEQLVNFEVEDTGITGDGEDTFFFENYKGELVSFEDYIAQTLNNVRIQIAQTVSLAELLNSIANPLADNGQGTLLITDDHVADVKFEVPEPTTLAVLGLGLLGLGAAGRRKA